MRLLKESDVIRAIDKHTRENGTLDDDISVILEEAETAFDKEKVMDKLKHCRDYYDINEQPKKPFDHWECADIRERKGKWMAYDDAIEIVEKGGIE